MTGRLSGIWALAAAKQGQVTTVQGLPSRRLARLSTAFGWGPRQANSTGWEHKYHVRSAPWRFMSRAQLEPDTPIHL